MTARLTHTIIALGLFAAAASVQAEYKCSDPPSRIDERACAEAQKGPDSLRRFIQRMAWIRTNLQFIDYINRDTILAWEAMRDRERLIAEKAEVDAAPLTGEASQQERTR